MTAPQRAAPMGVPPCAPRLPRTALGLTVDAALAGPGTDLAGPVKGGPGTGAQGIMRDPPASSPTALGINAGAGFADVPKATGVELPRK
ncbi:hypothetical protein [Streptomyces umbrinus]|uniref:hypothetical protein n=1 Tax=Streptomyces umbrinus TaxID=67370 RepID=UPI0033D8CE22